MGAEQARDRLRQVLPHLRIAMGLAKVQVPGCEVTLCIAGRSADGSGKTVCHFGAEEFVTDLETVIGLDDEGDELDALMADPERLDG